MEPERTPRSPGGDPQPPLGDSVGYWLREAVRLLELGHGNRRLEVAVRMAYLEHLDTGIQIQSQTCLRCHPQPEREP